nr:transposase, Ptta/En/Spm, transposase, Tnp1/En/Spm-like protein [Tanacetum cinerariifolium]
MADVNVNAPADQAPIMAPPTRTGDQILPHIIWCQLDEQWFNLTKDTLRDALQITPVNNNNAFSSPPTPDARINFVNDLGSDPDSPALKPVKATKKSKPSTPKADLWTPVTKPDSSQQPKPKPAPAKALKETLKSVYDAHRGPLPSVFIREPDSRKYQPLPEVQRNEKDEGQAGPNPVDVAASQPQSSHVVHDGPNLEHMDLEATDVSTKLDPEQIDKGFGDLFFNDKTPKADNEKTTAETKAESMVSVTIQQDTSSIPPMTTPIIDLTLRPDSPNVHRPLQTTATETTTTTTTTTHPPPPQPQQSTTYSMLMKHISKLEQIMANLIQDNKHLEERLDSYGVHLEKSMNRDHTDEFLKDLAEARKKKKKRHDLPKIPPGSPPHQPPPLPLPTGPSGSSRSPRASGSSQVLPPPPPPPSTNQIGQSHGFAAPSSSKTATSAEYIVWTTTDTRIRPSVSSTPKDLHVDDDMAPDAQVHSSDDDDIENAHIPKVNLRQDWWKPLEEDRPATPEHASIPSSDLPVSKKNWASALALAFELVKVFHPNVIHLQYQIEECRKLLTDSVDDSIIRHNVSKPLPLGGPPSQVIMSGIIQSDFFFNKDLEYLRYGSKGSRSALSISKMKAAYYPDVVLEQMVPNQLWIEEECKYDIADIIEVFSMYGYDYLKKIILRRTDLNEHIIAERDFKYLYPSDFEDLYLLNLQGKRKPRKGQNRIKTGQKQEAWRSREKFKAVAVDKERKTEENAKRMVENAYTEVSQGSTSKMESKGKKERVKSIASKAKKESSDDETSTSESDDEEYAMAVRNLKQFFRRKGRIVRKPREEKKSFRKRDDKKGKRTLGDKIICDFDKTTDFSQRSPQNCPKCGNPVKGHYCQGFPFVYSKQCYNQDFNFPQEFQGFCDFQQQDLCCENGGVTHEAYQYQPKNKDYYHEQNSCYDSNSFSFDQFLPQQYTINHPVFTVQNELFDSQNKLMEQLTSMCNMVSQLIQKKEEEKKIKEAQAANARYWKIPACYDDDDDYNFAITPTEPVNSLSMGDENPDTIPTTESDEFIKSSVENLVPIPSEYEGESECDVPAREEFTTFSNILFDADYEFDSSDDQSFYDEDIPEKIFSSPLFEEEIFPIKIDSHHHNAESDLTESLRTHDSSIIISSKIDSLLDEFTSELTLLKSITPGIDENDCNPEDEIRLIERLLYDY